MIAKNTGRTSSKKLRTTGADGPKVKMFEFSDLRTQADRVALEIKQLSESGTVRFAEVSVLMRSMRSGALNLSSHLQRAFLQHGDLKQPNLDAHTQP